MLEAFPTYVCEGIAGADTFQYGARALRASMSKDRVCECSWSRTASAYRVYSWNLI
jgi:hypothetical protein